MGWSSERIYMLKWLHDNDVLIYSICKERKSVAERFIGTL